MMIMNDSDSKIRLFFQDRRKLLFSGMAGEGTIHCVHALGFIRGN
jgi:hypothetical protein